ncbi:MAG: NAD-dependent epimerase/dehydratase family protein, partial [Candidatus Heimdallarchaeota archaeon]
MAKILLTGAFGNVGTSTLNELVKHNHHIRCFDIPTKRNKKKARKFKNFQGKIEFFWGDLRNSSDVDKAVEDREVIIHLGAIIPPLANSKPEIAEPVNIGGTKNILNAMKKQANPPRLLFSSSVATYGDVRHKGLDYIIQIDDEFNPSPHDHYARHKVKCEDMIRKSGLEWVIFRFSAISPIDQGLDGRAMARAAVSDEVVGKTLHIAGGPINRMPYEQFVGGILDAMGIGRLPKEAYGKEPFHCGYMDTTESQRILQYQEHTFEDYIAITKKRLAFARILVLIFRPIVRYWLLNQSPYYKAHINSMKQYLKPKRRQRKPAVAKTKGIKTKDITTKI